MSAWHHARSWAQGRIHVRARWRARAGVLASAGKGGKKGGGAKGGGGDKKDKKSGGLVLDSVFTMHTQSMDLKVDETQELTVYAFPNEVRSREGRVRL